MGSVGLWTTIFTGVIAVATVAYVLGTFMLWCATRQTASRTKELALQARDAFNLQVLASYLQSRATAIAFAQPPGSSEARAQSELDLLEGLLQQTFPDRWKEISAYIQKAARGKGPYVSHSN